MGFFCENDHTLFAGCIETASLTISPNVSDAVLSLFHRLLFFLCCDGRSGFVVIVGCEPSALTPTVFRSVSVTYKLNSFECIGK